MALLRLSNPLVFPGGVSPGFDPNHLAARNIRLSAIAQRAGGFISLDSARTPTLTSSQGSVFTAFGNAVNFPSTHYSYVTFPYVNEQPTAVTFAAVITPNTSLSYAGIINNNGQTNVTASSRLLLNTLIPTIYINGTNVMGVAPALTLGHTYFIAASSNGTTTNLVEVDLSTGSVISYSYTTTPKVIQLTTIGTINIGAYVSSTYTFGGYIFAAMYAVNNFLSLPQLLAWAQAPWDFWYPQTARSLISSLAKQGGVSVAASLAATWAAPSDQAAASRSVTLSGASAWLPADHPAAASSLAGAIAETASSSDHVAAGLRSGIALSDTWSGSSDALVNALTRASSFAETWAEADHAAGAASAIGAGSISEVWIASDHMAGSSTRHFSLTAAWATSDHATGAIAFRPLFVEAWAPASSVTSSRKFSASLAAVVHPADIIAASTGPVVVHASFASSWRASTSAQSTRHSGSAIGEVWSPVDGFSTSIVRHGSAQSFWASYGALDALETYPGLAEELWTPVLVAALLWRITAEAWASDAPAIWAFATDAPATWATDSDSAAVISTASDAP